MIWVELDRRDLDRRESPIGDGDIPRFLQYTITWGQGGGRKAGRAVVAMSGPASQKPPMQQSSLARLFERKKNQI